MKSVSSSSENYLSGSLEKNDENVFEVEEIVDKKISRNLSKIFEKKLAIQGFKENKQIIEKPKLRKIIKCKKYKVPKNLEHIESKIKE